MIFVLCGFCSLAQETKRSVLITRTTANIVIDGQGMEEDWNSTDLLDNFFNKFPLDSGFSATKTEVRILFDDANIYVLAVCHDEGKRVISSLKRDQGTWGSDLFTMVIDPINNRANGFVFGVNAGGSQWDGDLVMGGDEPDVNRNWDNKWYSKVKRYPDRWIVEMAIPFKSIRYDSDNRNWGINFERIDQAKNIRSTWSKVPRQFRSFDLGYSGELIWEELPNVSKGNLVLIPYAFSGVTRDFEERADADVDVKVGIDAKIALTSSLNLDLTINPDFSNVDVDQQQTNLSRFELFFPERRNFFLENSSLFNDFGSFDLQPFFSRRIGLESKIKYGARITGNLTKKMRIGLMNLQTDGEDGGPNQSYSIASIEQRLFGRTNIKGFFANKYSFSSTERGKDFNSLGGLEIDYLSSSGNINGSLKGHLTQTEDYFQENGFFSGSLGYNGEQLEAGIFTSRVGTNYITELGFVPRLTHYDALQDTLIRIGYYDIGARSSYSIYPDSPTINTHEFEISGSNNLDINGRLLQRDLSFRYNIEFQNTSRIDFGIERSIVELPFETDLIGDMLLPVGRYSNNSYLLDYSTDSRRSVNASVFLGYGGFFNGSRFSVGSDLNYRPKQPWGNFSLSYELNQVELPDDFGSETLHLFGPKTEVYFSSLMSWTTWIQYNSQDENININSRFQWRFKPMSDLFLVYSDNYASNGFNVKNRGVVLKLNYWLNI